MFMSIFRYVKFNYSWVVVPEARNDENIYIIIKGDVMCSSSHVPLCLVTAGAILGVLEGETTYAAKVQSTSAKLLVARSADIFKSIFSAQFN
jgi:hypothetical protein